MKHSKSSWAFESNREQKIDRLLVISDEYTGGNRMAAQLLSCHAPGRRRAFEPFRLPSSAVLPTAVRLKGRRPLRSNSVQCRVAGEVGAFYGSQCPAGVRRNVCEDNTYAVSAGNSKQLLSTPTSARPRAVSSTAARVSEILLPSPAGCQVPSRLHIPQGQSPLTTLLRRASVNIGVGENER